jgi:hypothetical protein
MSPVLLDKCNNPHKLTLTVSSGSFLTEIQGNREVMASVNLRVHQSILMLQFFEFV